MASKRSRRPAKELVFGTLSTRLGWYELLSEEDQEYVREVAREISVRPDAAVYTVARSLIDELGIKRSDQHVVRKLKELIRHEQTKTKRVSRRVL